MMKIYFQHTCDDILHNILPVSVAFWNWHELFVFYNIGTLSK